MLNVILSARFDVKGEGAKFDSHNHISLVALTQVSFVYQYFCAIFDNAYFNTEIRDDLLRGIIDVLCDIRDKNEGEIKKEVLLLIVKYDILLNENIDKET